jgi:hypothetical protein
MHAQVAPSEHAMQTSTSLNKVTGTYTVWKLAENAAVPLPRSRSPKLVRVERGTVLITREGDPDDHVLVTGDELLLDVRGLAVAWAFTDAAISLHEAR